MLSIPRTTVASALPATLPASYVGFFDHFSDPMKVAGFVVLVLQGVYTCVQIWRALKEKKNGRNDEN